MADTGSPEWAVEFLQSLGWSRTAAIALVANLMWESGGKGGTINWAAHGDRGKDGEYHSHGAGQWNDAHGRWDNLLEFTEDRGTDWTDPETQLRFLDKEMRESERTVRKNLKEAPGIDEAVCYAALRFWRPSLPHIDKRVKIARNLAKEIGDGGTKVADAGA